MKTLLFLLLIPGVVSYCFNDQHCSDHGVCIKAECHCENDWATFESELGCNYQKKKFAKALALQVFLGLFGAPWVYLFRIDYLIITTSTTSAAFITCALTYQKRSLGWFLIRYMLVFASFALWVINTYNLAKNNILDGNGIPLA